MVQSRQSRETANRLLRALPPLALARLWSRLHQVELDRHQVIHQLGRPITHLYFVDRGLISLFRTMRDGRTVEIGAVGAEGMIGAHAAFGVRASILDSIVHIPGTAYRIGVDALRAEMAHSTALRDLIQRYAHFRLTQLVQSAACNRLHTLEQRCCRWLLIAHDSARIGSFPITQEFLAMMLGVQRTGVSLTLNGLQRKRLIRGGRGSVTILDRAGLEAIACECYGTIRAELDRLFAPRPQLVQRRA
jgi:CRP-like cAMP-binding protein